jgi:hypothetical protein
MPRLIKASLLLFVLSLCAAAFLVAHRVEERRPTPAPHDLFVVVNEQLAAFRAADFQGAYRHAATGVQQKFSLPQFEAMVRYNYAPLAGAHRVEFGSVKVQGGVAFVEVFFFAADGSARSYLYNLISEGESWKVAGVEELDRKRVPAVLGGSHA